MCDINGRGKGREGMFILLDCTLNHLSSIHSTRLPSPIPIPASLPKTFIAFAKDIACGMTYLSRKNYVHRDLAARNIFLTEDLRCKVHLCVHVCVSVCCVFVCVCVYVYVHTYYITITAFGWFAVRLVTLVWLET